MQLEWIKLLLGEILLLEHVLNSLTVWQTNPVSLWVQTVNLGNLSHNIFRTEEPEQLNAYLFASTVSLTAC